MKKTGPEFLEVRTFDGEVEGHSPVRDRLQV